MMSPSAPQAMAARAIAGTCSRTPVPWLGSAMIGRCDNLCTTGIALRSNVLRTSVSHERMPRSHRITCVLPSARMYSALSRNSVIVAARPRLSSTGLPMRPTALSNE